MTQSNGAGEPNHTSRRTATAVSRAAKTPGRVYRDAVWLTILGTCAVACVAVAACGVAITSIPGLAAEQVAQIWRILAIGGAAATVVIGPGIYAATTRTRVRLGHTMAALTEVAESVAAGDLAVEFTASSSRGTYGRLNRAMAGMLEELRRLTTAIGGSATSTAAMAAEITTGTEQMSATAHEIAETSDVLSQQSMEMAGTLQHVNTDATRLLAIAGDLATGAREGVERNAHLRLLADANRLRLDASAAALTTLATQVGSSAAAVEGVAAASEEIRAFVALVQKMARQSKLLALNAAMEAARAGEQGAGFAVVAGEVRRLAASSTDAAERTVNVVNEVLARVAESRASSAQTVQTVQTVLEASREGARTFGEVSDALEVAGRWTSSIADAAVLSSELVADMTRDLDSLAHGTEAFAAAMQQVAASSQEQSASTHEIATAAAALAAHARHLGELTGGFGGATPAVAAAAGRATRPSPAGAAAPLHRRSPATRRATAVAAD